MKTNSLTIVAGTLLLAVGACDRHDSHQGPPLDVDTSGADVAEGSGGMFAGPEGIMIMAGRIWVANVNGSWDQATGQVKYGEGYVAVLGLSDLAEEARLVTPWLNPQYLFVAGDRIGAVCSGTVEAGDDGVMQPAEDGGLLLLNRETLAVEREMAVPGGAPGPLAGFPGAPAADPEGETVFLGSGTGPYVYRIATETGAVEAFQIHDDLSGNDLTVPLFLDGVLYVTSFNTGYLYALDPDSGAQSGAPIDVTATDEIEGPIDMDHADGRIYVVHSISMQVVAVDPAAGEVDKVCTAGAAANRIVATGNAVIVVNSMDNSLTWCNTHGGGAVSPFAALPLASNPWDVALAGDEAYVTGFKSNALYLVNLTTGAIVDTVR
jgi:hypothetical protein